MVLYSIGGEMEFKKVTLNIDKKVYEEFKSYCKSNGLVASKTVEKLMLIKSRGNNNEQS